MPEIKRSALMPYSARVMYDIVNDVEHYPDFLPWCGDARLEYADEHSLQAAILIQVAGLNHWFTTRNTMVVGESIDIALVDGPFSKLDGRWRFTPINAQGCKIELVMNFEIRHGFAGAIITPAFTRIADTLVESFCDRARQQHER